LSLGLDLINKYEHGLCEELGLLGDEAEGEEAVGDGGGGACEVFGEGARGMNVSEYGCCTGCGGFGEAFGEILAGVLDAGGGVFSSDVFGSNLGEGAGGGDGEGAGAGGPVDPAPDPCPLPLPLFPLLLP
jgi:hypothetical protein